MIQTLKVTESGSRIDAYIAANIPDISRSYSGQLLDDGRVKVSGVSKLKASYKVCLGDIIEIDIPDPVMTETKPQDIPLDIVYEDNDLIIINKPQGMVVHPACGHHEDTLVNALLHHCEGNLSDINGVIRPGIVHRIDKDTSGLMVACKNNETHQIMADMMSRHEVKRKYRCVVHGVISADKGTIDAPIGRSSTDRRKMAVVSDGKPSVTHFTVVKRYKDATDVELLLETGRTHQIRAHMTYIGHPLIGDPVYSGRRKSYGLDGQCLHSKEISFTHPITGELISYEIDLPDYYKELLSKLIEL